MANASNIIALENLEEAMSAHLSGFPVFATRIIDNSQLTRMQSNNRCSVKVVNEWPDILAANIAKATAKIQAEEDADCFNAINSAEPQIFNSLRPKRKEGDCLWSSLR